MTISLRYLIVALGLALLPLNLTAQEAAESEPVSAIDEPTEIIDDPVDITEEIEDTVSDSTMQINLFIRIGIAAAVIILQIVFSYLVKVCFNWLHTKATEVKKTRLKPIKIKNYQLFNSNQILGAIHFFLKVMQVIATVFQLFITIPIVFSLFEPTKDFASILFSYIFNPLKAITRSFIDYIPNLITIIIIVIVTMYIVRALRFFSIQIERKKLVLPGFYADWARPTFNILRVLLYAFAVIVIYPFLPNSESDIFRGVSVFIGLIFSLGSSSLIGNMVAGIVITYMRPFKLGDRIKIGEVIGFVVEKSATVIRIRTHKNEYITIPNTTILTSSITNYNFSTASGEPGLTLYLDVTMGYSIPWRTMHKILLEAADKTQCVLKEPKPFVLETALEDFYCRYELNVFTKDVAKVPSIYSELHQNLQDGFTAAGISLYAPHFQIYMKPDQEAPARQRELSDSSSKE
jgi:small-conductance mechanosensitive channel